MSKKHFGKFLAAVVIAGAAAAGCIAYFTKYRDFQKSLDEDFNDFEDEVENPDKPVEPIGEEDGARKTKKTEEGQSVKREYVSIPLDTPETAETSNTPKKQETSDNPSEHTAE